MNDVEKRILIVDKIGELSKIYSYAAFAYVGGGFKKKITQHIGTCSFQHTGNNWSIF